MRGWKNVFGVKRVWFLIEYFKALAACDSGLGVHLLHAACETVGASSPLDQVHLQGTWLSGPACLSSSSSDHCSGRPIAGPTQSKPAQLPSLCRAASLRHTQSSLQSVMEHEGCNVGSVR